MIYIMESEKSLSIHLVCNMLCSVCKEKAGVICLGSLHALEFFLCYTPRARRHLLQISFVAGKQAVQCFFLHFLFQLCLHFHFLCHNKCQGFPKIKLQRDFEQKVKKINKCSDFVNMCQERCFLSETIQNDFLLGKINC